MHKYIIILYTVLIGIHISVAQNVTNVCARQEGDEIIITYDLSHKSIVHIYMDIGKHRGIELKAIIGDVGKDIAAGKNKKIVWQPLKEGNDFIAQNVSFRIEALSAYNNYVLPWWKGGKKIETFLLGEVGYSITPQWGFGVMLGQLYQSCGWYIKGRSNFHFPHITTTLACDEGGFINWQLPFYSGNKITTEWLIDGGFVWNILATARATTNRFNSFGIYLGAGYGSRNLYWELTDGRWAQYTPTSHHGLSFDCGIIGSLYGLTFSAGINTIQFDYLEVELGIGWMF